MNVNVKKGAEPARIQGIRFPREMKVKCEIYRDSVQNYRKYGIPKAQLVIAAICMAVSDLCFVIYLVRIVQYPAQDTD